MTARRSKVRYEKSTRGCRTCKLRKIKCDETSPSCLNCTSTGRQCEGPRRALTFVVQSGRSVKSATSQSASASVLTSTGYATVSNSHLERNIGAIVPTLSSGVPQEEKRAVSFFIAQCAPYLSGKLDRRFWGESVPKLAHFNVVVWNAICSLACTHEFHLGESQNLQSQAVELQIPRVKASRWYGRALSNQRQKAATASPAELLISAVLFCSIEMQRRNLMAGLRLMRTTYNLMWPFLRFRSSVDLDITAEAVFKMTMRNASFVCTSDMVVETCDVVIHNMDEAWCTMSRIIVSVYGLLKEIHYAVVMHQPNLLALRDCHRVICSTLATWNAKMTQFRSTALNKNSEVNSLAEYYKVSTIWLENMNDLLADDFESVEPDFVFVSIIRSAEQVIDYLHSTRPQSYDGDRPLLFKEVMLTPPLYYVAIMSPIRETRDKAADLMKQYTSQEIWSTSSWIDHAQRRFRAEGKQRQRKRGKSSLLRATFSVG